MRWLHKWLLKRSGYGTTRPIPNVHVTYSEHRGAFKSVALVLTDEAQLFAKEIGEALQKSCRNFPGTMGDVTLTIIDVGNRGAVVEVEFKKLVTNIDTIRLCTQSVAQKHKLMVVEEIVIRWMSRKTASELFDFRD